MSLQHFNIISPWHEEIGFALFSEKYHALLRRNLVHHAAFGLALDFSTNLFETTCS